MEDKGKIDGQKNQLNGKGERKERPKSDDMQEKPAAVVDGDEVSIPFLSPIFLLIIVLEGRPAF
jgi:hypothetical protein